MRARKRFGQHFLHDESVLQNIVNVMHVAPTDRLMEIGPGQGALTALLIDEPQLYRAVEIDRDLVPLLQARFAQLELFNADILRVELADVLEPGQSWRVFGNLPYNISSPLLAVLTEFLKRCPGRIADMHFMLQKEMAQRLTAQPGTKAWGRLSVMVQLNFDVEMLFDVAPESFSPPPKVWSSVVRMVPLKETVCVDIPVLEQVLRLAFSGRRKRLSNSLKTLDLDWSQIDLDPGLRADDVSAEDYVKLASYVKSSVPDRSTSVIRNSDTQEQ
jgi:16S rRNA (adenine1518-N6/adenine1519-N6)-dimethyltransferase